MSLIRKTFTSHMAYSRQRNVFLKLKGTGLGPELLTDFNGYLEYSCDEGPTLLERFRASLGDPAALAAYFEAFCDWYNSYRGKTNLALGDADPEKFVFTKTGLIYTDFEDCRPGYAEQDLASMVRHFCSLAWPQAVGASSPKPEASASPQPDVSASPQSDTLVSPQTMFAALSLFVCVCAAHIHWRPDLFEKYLRLQLADLNPKTVESLVTYMTCCGVVISTGSGEAVGFASSAVANMPQRILCVNEGSDLSFPGFHRINCSSEASAMYTASRQCSQPWMFFLSGDMTGLNPDALQKLFSFGKKGVDAVFFNDYWDHVTPILIRTEAVRSHVDSEMADDQICAVLKREASVRLLISDSLFLEE